MLGDNELFGNCQPSAICAAPRVPTTRCSGRPGAKHPVPELGRHAEGKGVKVLFETHDYWIRPDLVRRVIEHADHPNVRVLWDVHHPYRIAEIPIAEVWNALGLLIESVDIKDSRVDPAARLGYRFVKLGEGDIPIFEALTPLARAGYQGWLNFEWEKRWHPDIEEPEVSFPHFRNTMTKLLAAIG